MSLYRNLLFLKTILGLVKDPNRTEDVIKLAEMARSVRSVHTEIMEETLMSHPEFRKIYEEKYIQQKPVTEELLKLPKNSLGYAYARHMSDNGLSLEIFPDVAPVHLVDYFVLRIRHTHDIWHAITGFNTSVEDEIGLQAFAYAQTHSSLSSILICGGLFHFFLKKPRLLPVAFEQVYKGYRMGREANCALAYKFDHMWEMDLNEVRRKMKITPSVRIDGDSEDSKSMRA